MEDKAEIYLRLLAISNIIMAMLAGAMTFRWPLIGSAPTYSNSFAMTVFIIFMLDLILTRNVFNLLVEELPELFNRTKIWIVRGYYGVSFLVRLLAVAEGAYVVEQADTGDPINGAIVGVMFSSVYFAYIINIFRKSPLGINVKGGLLAVITLNIMTIVYIALPFVVNELMFEVNIVYLVIFLVGGLFKWLSYFVASITYYRWSTSLFDEEYYEYVEEESDSLYPTEKEEQDIAWPTT